MNISEVNLRFTTKDIMSIIEDFVEVSGLTIEAVTIGKNIEIKGRYKKIININFKGVVSLVGVTESSVELKLISFSVLKLPIFKWITNIVLKKVLKELSDIGINYKDGLVVLKINDLLKLSPIKLGVKLKALKLELNSVIIEAVDINIGIKNNVAEDKTEKEEVVKQAVMCKSDKYSQVRRRIKEKIPSKFNDITPYIMIMPDLAALLVRLYKDSRVPFKTKAICAGAFAYAVSPFDIVPDFIPVVGEMDDFGVVFYALNKILNDVPEDIIIENWQGREDIIKIIRGGVNYINNITSKNKLSAVFKIAKDKIKNRKKSREIKAIEKEKN